METRGLSVQLEKTNQSISRIHQAVQAAQEDMLLPVCMGSEERHLLEKLGLMAQMAARDQLEKVELREVEIMGQAVTELPHRGLQIVVERNWLSLVVGVVAVAVDTTTG
jgi:hypothetical protein